MLRQVRHISTFRVFFQLNRLFCKVAKPQARAQLSQTLPAKAKNPSERENELISFDEETVKIAVPVERDYQLVTEEFLRTTDKKQLSKIPTPDLIEINKYICASNDSTLRELVWQKLEAIYSKRIDSIEIKEIAEILWLYAYSNRKNPQFFKTLEDGFLSKDFAEDIDAKIIKKILWGFSHSNTGSTVLYSQMSTHIKRIYHEIHPLMLAEYAYYFSKASASMKGGFGVYQIAEDMIIHRIRNFDVLQIRRICEYLLPQNIGSNNFYKVLEESILKLYRDDLTPSVLVSLCKSTSTFRFQTNLASRLEKNILEYIEHLSNSQLEDILWSYSRGRKGSDELYEKLEAEFIKRMNLLKPRGVAFSFSGFSKMDKFSYELVQKYQEYIFNNIERFNFHYLTKILVGLSKVNPMFYSSDLVSTIFGKIVSSESNIPVHEVLRVLESMQDLTVSVKTINWDEIYTRMEEIIKINISKLTPSDLSQFLFQYILSNQGSPTFIKLLEQKLVDINQIPKTSFCEGFFSYVEMSNLDTSFEFVPIIEELCSYGNIKYFFDHTNFIRLIWGLATLVHSDPSIVIELQKFSQQNVKESLMEINLNTLKQDTLRLYLQTWALFKSLGSIEATEEDKLYQKFEELNSYQRNELIENDPTMQGDATIRTEVYKLISDFVESKKLRMSLIKEMKDEYYNIIDIALINEETMDKIGVLIYNKTHYLKCSDFKTKKQQIQNKIAFLEAFDWRIVEVEEDDWIALGNEEKENFIQKSMQSALFGEKVKKVKGPRNKSRRQKTEEFPTEDETQV